MARDVHVLRCDDGREWVAGAFDDPARAGALAALAEAERQLRALKESGDADTADGQRSVLTTQRRRAHNRVDQQCMVEIGRANVINVDEIGRNAKVTLRPDQLVDPIHGFLDMTDIGAWGKLQTVIRSGGRCRYRIIVHREAGIDPSLPWDKVPDRKRIRDLVALEPLDATAGPTDRPGEPAASAPSPPPPAANGHGPAASAPGGAALMCPICGKSTTNAGPVLKHQPTARFAHKACLTDAPPAPAEPPTTAPPAEPPARPELRSLIGGAMGTVELAIRLLVDKRGEAPIGQVRTLAHHLDDAIEAAKRKGAGERARDAVRIAAMAVPPPWGDPARYPAWVDELSSYAAGVASLAAELAVRT